MNYAIDRKTIASALLGKYGSPISELPSADGFDSKYRNYYGYDPQKARALLAAAGYADGFTVDALILEGSWVPVAQATAKYLDAVGVHLNLKIVSATVWAQTILGPNPLPMQTTGAFSFSRPMSNQYLNLLAPGATYNKLGGGLLDSTVTKLYLKGIRAANPSAYWKQISARSTTLAYFLPVVATNSIVYASPKIKGVRVSQHLLTAVTAPSTWSPK
jgi:peptide/nickel transport system substrate-binding protein